MRLIALCLLPAVLAFASTSQLRPQSTELRVRGGGGLRGRKGDVFMEIAPLWSSFTKAIKTHVEPVLRDPNGCLLQPISQFAKQHAKEARKRQLHYQSSPQEALGLVFLSPIRIVRVSITALVLAEVADYMGLLQSPNAAAERFRNALKSARIDSIQLNAKNVWKRARRQGGLLHAQTYASPMATLAAWQPKHQFAVGASFGLLTSQLFWALSSQIFKTTIVVYVLSELNEVSRRYSGKSVTQHFNSALSKNVETGLNRVRLCVRRSLQDPIHLLEAFPDLIERHVPNGGLPSSTRTGLASGLVAGIMIP